MDSTITKIINKALDGNFIDEKEMKRLLELDDFSDEAKLLKESGVDGAYHVIRVEEEAHNPNLLGAQAGANVFFAEVGANPRDADAETEGSEGLTVPACIEMFEEAGCKVNTGASKIFPRG